MGFESHATVWQMMANSGPIVQGVLVILIFLSIWSWAIAIAKFIYFRKVDRDSEEFVAIFWESRDLYRINDATRRLAANPLVQIFKAGYDELQRLVNAAREATDLTIDIDTELKTIERALKRAELEEFKKLTRGTTFLATVASSAPFIGLFGTVWGIMRAFQGLGTAKTATIQAVAPGISEALVATAIGLAAAIPAAIAYNYFSSVIKTFRASMESFTAEFVNMAERYFV
ncbi:MAG: protein TolQ [Candidatus Dadabacteria bacterium]|nr:MAG: protein TolQ [Candidatus Dadabacteria bacterium]